MMNTIFRYLQMNHIGFNSTTGHFEGLPEDWQKKIGGPLYPLCEALIYHETPRYGFVKCPCNNYDTKNNLVRRCKECKHFFCGERHMLEPLEDPIRNDKRGESIWAFYEDICIFCSDKSPYENKL